LSLDSGNIGVAEKALNSADVGAGFQQVGGEGMPEGVASDAFVEIGLADGIAVLAGHGIVVEMVSGVFAGSGMGAKRCCREEPVPGPLARSIGKFAEEGFRDMAVGCAGGEVLIETGAEIGEVLLETAFKGAWQWDDAVFETDGAAEGIDDANELRIGITGARSSGECLKRRRSSHLLGNPAHADGFTGEGAVVGFEGAGLIGEGLPIEGGCPWDGEDITGENAGGVQRLARLPVLETGGTGEGVEPGLGAFGGLVAAGFDP